MQISDNDIDQLIDQVRAYDGKQFSYVQVDDTGVSGKLLVDWTFTRTQLADRVRLLLKKAVTTN